MSKTQADIDLLPGAKRVGLPCLPAMGTLWQTATQRVLLAFGMWFTLGNYVAGTLIWPSTITDPNAMHMTHLFGFMPVMINGWHLYFHLVTGLICLALAMTRGRAVVGALSMGVLYLVTGAVGMLVPGHIFGFIMADAFGNWVHVAEGLGLLGTGAAALSLRPSQPAG